ncbi:LuxR family transcriptional regulator [Sphaerisporangium sp. TRM90804]|uniref:ATP-binding protein n=1 Tax=Sphaerisporangium sp. TRM90804 TaxID=3031113 RepID=UPI00244C9C3E|nr:LuxR family transcriptional regulator [Sphaerisporangium sp. TRM90804]MDH2426347.1 AAA family ATPase [Sphaerisporangium sp. TRM90804]
MAMALFGREREIAQVESLVARIPEHGDALVVSGEAGIGKSALLAVALDCARARGFATAIVAGVQSETHLPFAGLHQLIQPMLAAASELPVAQRDALLDAFGMGDGQTPQPFLIALAVLNLLGEAAAAEPLLVVVDDLQWLDRPTTEVLAFVARRLRSEPIGMLLAVREGYATTLDDVGLPELSLGTLDPSAAEELLDSRPSRLSAGVRWRVLAEAAGNPLALVELPIALGREPGPLAGEFLPLTARLERSFATRLAELPRRTRVLLLAGAANDGHDLREALTAAGTVTGTRLSPADLAPAVDLGLVTRHEWAIRFRHPLVRSAIYHRAGPLDRQVIHLALADVHAPDPDRRAWHRAAALDHPDESVAADLEQVALRARRRGALTVAVTALRRAAELSEHLADRAMRLLRAAELAFELGRGELITELLALTDPTLLGELERARLAWLNEMLEEGRNEGPQRVRRLIATAEELENPEDQALARNFVRAAAIRCWWRDPGAELRDRVISLAERLAAHDDDPELLVALAAAAPVERAGELIERLTRLRETRMDGAMARLLGVAASAIGAHELSAAFLDDSIGELRAQGRLGVLAQALTSQMLNHVWGGDWPSAMLVAEECERLTRETRQPRWQSAALSILAVLAGLRGEADQGLELAAQSERVLGSVTIASNIAQIQYARGVIALCAGRHADAFGHLWRVFDRRDAAHHPIWGSWTISELAEAAVTAEHRDLARTALAELEVMGAQTPSPYLHVGLRHARAVLAHHTDAESLFETALEADLSSWPTARARLLLAHGVWLRRRRRITEARGPLRAARDACDKLGLLAWGEKARQELRATGEGSHLRVPSSAEQLTPQELHIAKLAATGLSNREIGQQLYLSHRTVGTHLHHAFRKLGIASRAQLRDVL